MEARKAIWRLRGLIGQMKSLRKQGVLTAGQELAIVKELHKALREQELCTAVAKAKAL